MASQTEFSIRKGVGSMMLDHMTGALSEDCFSFQLELERKRAMRYAYFFSVIEVEFDQTEGNELLDTLAKLVQQSIRSTDLMGRTDHLGLSVLLHDSDVRVTKCVGDRIRGRVENHNFEALYSPCRLTVSVGGASFPTHTTDLPGLLLTAKEMVLKAKSMGGNTVSLPDL